IKNAATGCGPSGWDCITSSYTYYLYNEKLPYDLKAGNTYYIMVDNVGLYGASLIFDLTCATGCAQYADIDGDGYGDPENANYSCFPVLGYVPDNSDCNDLSAAVNIDATEDCSNNIDDNCNGQINENCNQPPVAVCQNLVVSADINCEGIATAEDFNNGSSDPDSDPLTYSVLPVGPYPLGITNVVLTVTDPLGEFAQCNATINVIDDAPPVFNAAPTNTSYRCITEVPAPGSLGWTDNCDGAGNVTGVDISDGLACPETITRTWTFTDASGNSTSVSQIIVVNDDVAPVIAGVGANAIVECPATPVFSTPTVSDDCDINAALTFTDVTTQGNCASNYSITRTWTAFDVCGNSSTTSQTITVEDNTAPAIQCAADLSFCDGDPVVLILPVANDACGSVTITNDAPVLFSPGNHVVTWTATDACGNSSSCTQTVTVHYLNAIIDETDVLCYGDNSGSLLVNYFAIPPANPVSILYSVDGGLTTQSSNIFLGLPAGNYNITIINTASNCTTTVSSAINQPAAPLSVVVSSTNSCPGSNTGTLSVTPAGGTIGYTIEWFDVTNTKVNTPGAVGAGTYTVVVTDANKCSVTAAVTVGQNPGPSVSLGNNKVVFYGALGYNGCHNLTANATGNGPFIYNWSSTDPNATIATSSGNILNVCVTVDTMYTYTVLVTDANGCTNTASINVIYSNIDCSNQQNSTKVKICMVPPGNPANCQTVCIGINAAQNLLNNGSYLGPCQPNCAPPATAKTVISTPVSQTMELNIYPNPTSTSVHIEYRSETNNAEAILITDLQGRLIEKINIQGVFEFHGNVDISKFDNGIYFINIMSGDAVLKTAKLVKTE
nr:T9SS type A sorting domain-containing protein [Nitrosopumilus sp.]